MKTKWSDITFALACVSFVLWANTAVAGAPSIGASPDQGTDSDGNMKVPTSLTKRCGLSSDSPETTDDCLKRLAYDYYTRKSVGFGTYDDLRNAVVREISKAYFASGAERLQQSSSHEEDLKDTLGEFDVSNVSTDMRATMKQNSEVGQDNTAQMYDLLKVNNQRMYMVQYKRLFDLIIPSMVEYLTDEDKEDVSLAGPPQ